MTAAAADDFEMKGPVVTSFVFHAAILLALIIGLPHLKQPPLEMMQQIPIDIVEVGPVTTTQKVGVGNTAKVDTVPPPPAPPAPPPKPAPPQQKELARAMPKDDGPVIADKKLPPKVEKKENKKQDAQQFSSLLKNLTADKPKPAETPPQVTAEKPATAAPTGTQGIVSEHLTISQEDALRRQLEQCWNVPTGAKDAQDMVVEIQVEVNPDRTVKTAHIIDHGQMGDSFYRAAAESALRAVLNPKCSPLQLPEDKYDNWKDMSLRFNPKDML